MMQALRTALGASETTWRRATLMFLAILASGCLAVFWFSFADGASPHLITSDGKIYYAWARSLVLDQDLDFDNDLASLWPPDPPRVEQITHTPRGLRVNKYPPGLGLVEVPGTAVGHLLALALPGQPANGVSTPYQFAVAISLLGLGLFGLWCLFRALRYAGVAPAAAALGTAACAVCTNLVHYLAKEPAMAHATGFALLALLLMDLLRPRDAKTVSGARFMFWGALAGLLCIVRNSNALLLLVPFAIILRRGIPLRRAALPGGTGFVAVAMLQPLALFVLWGEWRLRSYPEEGLSGSITGLASTLLDARHGLWIYHPWYLVLLGLALWGLLRRRDGLITGSALIAFSGLVLVNGLWHCWWFGDSFGNRSFIEALPVLTLAAGLALREVPARRVLSLVPVAGLLCLLNLYLWVGYLLQAYPPDGLHTVADAYGWVLR